MENLCRLTPDRVAGPGVCKVERGEWGGSASQGATEDGGVGNLYASTSLLSLNSVQPTRHFSAPEKIHQVTFRMGGKERSGHTAGAHAECQLALLSAF